MQTRLLSSTFKFAAVAILALMASHVTHAQSWQSDIDWSAQDTGAVDCPQGYVELDVWYAVVAGGRSAAINAALFAIQGGNLDRAYSLVLLTQCHNPDAQDRLNDAGEKQVLRYLAENYTATGIDPAIIEQVIKDYLSDDSN